MVLTQVSPFLPSLNGDFEELVEKISISRKLFFCWIIDSVIFEAVLNVWVVFTRNALG